MADQIIQAMYGSPDRPLRIGDNEIQCYVLEDNRRVLHLTGMITSLGMAPGSASRSQSSGNRLEKFVNGVALQPFVSDDLRTVVANPIKFTLPTGKIAHGYEATILVDICEAVLTAREQEKLNHQQVAIAKQCEI